MVNIRHPKGLGKRRKILIAAHRGTNGGNIIQNTIPAYENALRHGADILEIDIAKSTDGDFYVFHTGQELGVLGINQRLDTMSTKEIQKYRLINTNQEKTNQKVNRLDDVLEHFKGRCLINIDRSWFYWDESIRYLKTKHMEDQLILKSPAKPRFYKKLEESQSDLMYMPIIREKKLLDRVFSYDINLIAAEIIFEKDDHPMVQKSFIKDMHTRGIHLWVNSITLEDKTLLSGRHDDNHAILQNMDDNWGWLIEKGFDIIHTDWPMLLREYIKVSNRRHSTNKPIE